MHVEKALQVVPVHSQPWEFRAPERLFCLWGLGIFHWCLMGGVLPGEGHWEGWGAAALYPTALGLRLEKGRCECVCVPFLPPFCVFVRVYHMPPPDSLQGAFN